MPQAATQQPHTAHTLIDLFHRRVMEDFVGSYEKGRTPNPCVACNAHVKFHAAAFLADELGFRHVATGHYAQLREQDGIYQLLRAEDGTKDQSYFLYRLNQAQLSKTLFPLADLYKREVRKIAEAEGLHVAAKKDSTGICFIGERPFKDFLARYLPPKKGEIRRLDDGKLMGAHDGLMYHTIGQRKGLHIGGLKEKGQAGGGDHDAWFVAGKDMGKNILYVVQGHDHPVLLRESLSAEQLSWTSGKAPRTHWVYTAKPRYRSSDQPCEIAQLKGDRCEIGFAEPQWALTPGQSVVVYESRVCLGGGIIV